MWLTIVWSLLIVIAIIILFALINFRKAERFKINIQDPRSFHELTDGEKITYIIDNYFLGDEEKYSAQSSKRIEEENKYIAQLPVSDSGCEDSYDECPKWAANNECVVNPEYMLYNCPKSCKACSLTPQQKYNIVQIYNTREPPNCVNHPGDESYPDAGRYFRRFELYRDEDGLV